MNSQSAREQVKRTKPKSKNKFLECGDIYMLRTDSKKKALAILQTKLHSERSKQERLCLSDYDSELSSINNQIKHTFRNLCKKHPISKKISKKRIPHTKEKESKVLASRKIRVGYFSASLTRITQDLDKWKAASSKSKEVVVHKERPQ